MITLPWRSVVMLTLTLQPWPDWDCHVTVCVVCVCVHGVTQVLTHKYACLDFTQQL